MRGKEGAKKERESGRENRKEVRLAKNEGRKGKKEEKECYLLEVSL